MSFIREVIDIVNENKVLDARLSIAKLVEDVKNFQFKIKKYIDDNYVDFLPNKTNSRKALGEGLRLFAEIEALRDNIENETNTNLLRLNTELVQSIEELEEVQLGLKTSNKILRIDELFQAIGIAKKTGDFLKVLEYTTEMKSLIYDKEDTVLRHLECFEHMKISFHIEQQMMLMNIKKQFDSLVQMTEKKLQKTKAVTIRITKDDNRLHEIVVALINSNFNTIKISEFLMENVFEPIVTRPVSIEYHEEQETAGFAELKLSFSLQPMADDLRPNYRKVFENLKTAFKCLGYMNISISPDVCMFSIIADMIKEKFMLLLRNKCLFESVPNTMDEMSESTLVSDVLEFHEFLCDMLFLDKDTDVELRDFAEKVDILFRNRFCTNIVNKAVAIMRHDLHDMELVAEVNPGGSNSGSPAIFESCMISKSTSELVKLMERVLRESSTENPELTTPLLSTVPKIVDRYLTEVPTCHAKLLLTIPQQTALFNNNCMYLAYWLVMNASKCNEPVATLIKSLQRCGSDHFSRQTNNQRMQLMDILKEFGEKHWTFYSIIIVGSNWRHGESVFMLIMNVGNFNF